MHADLQRLLADDLMSDLSRWEIGRLRQIRTEASVAENDVSFVRRIAQGRLDIVGHERNRRTSTDRSSGAFPDMVGLLYNMPDILADSADGSSTARSPRHLELTEPGAVAGELGDELDAIASPTELASLDEVDDGQLADLFDQLSSFEGELSTIRRQLHDRIDRLQAEIGRRYRDGELQVDTILTQE